MNSKQQLEVYLSKLKQIDSPQARLEQYITPSNIAAEVIWLAYMNGDIKNKTVADLGCGNGSIGIGCLLLRAKKVFFLDTDSRSILITKQNTKSLRNAIILYQDISSFDQKVDTVIQNPPFGVQNEHADRAFLIKAMENSGKVYSFHKLESESFIRAIARDHNFKMDQILNFRFPLKKTQNFHTKAKHEVKVGCFVLSKLAEPKALKTFLYKSR